MEPFDWKCPHCNRLAVVGVHNYESGGTGFYNKSSNGQSFLSWKRIVCPSPTCNKYEFVAILEKSYSKKFR